MVKATHLLYELIFQVDKESFKRVAQEMLKGMSAFKNGNAKYYFT